MLKLSKQNCHSKSARVQSITKSSFSDIEADFSVADAYMSSLVWPKSKGGGCTHSRSVSVVTKWIIYRVTHAQGLCLKDNTFFSLAFGLSDVFENGGFDCMMGTPISRFDTPKTSSSISATSIDSVVFLGRKLGLVYSIHRACHSIVKTLW